MCPESLFSEFVAVDIYPKLAVLTKKISSGGDRK